MIIVLLDILSAVSSFCALLWAHFSSFSCPRFCFCSLTLTSYFSLRNSRECKECVTLSRISTSLCHPMNWYCVRTFSHLPWAGRDITLLLHIQSVTAVLVVEGDKKSPTVMPQRCYGGLTSSLFCLLIPAAVLAVRDVNGSWSKSQRVRCFHHYKIAINELLCGWSWHNFLRLS